VEYGQEPTPIEKARFKRIREEILFEKAQDQKSDSPGETFILLRNLHFKPENFELPSISLPPQPSRNFGNIVSTA